MVNPAAVPEAGLKRHLRRVPEPPGKGNRPYGAVNERLPQPSVLPHGHPELKLAFEVHPRALRGAFPEELHDKAAAHHFLNGIQEGRAAVKAALAIENVREAALCDGGPAAFPHEIAHRVMQHHVPILRNTECRPREMPGETIPWPALRVSTGHHSSNSGNCMFRAGSRCRGQMRPSQ